MASSGTFTSGRYGGGSHGPWLTLAWTQVSQSVANNTTTLDLTLRFHWSANINYTFYSRTGSVQGNAYTYSGSVSGTSGSRVLRTQRVTITHNSDGAKSVTLSGNITSLGLSWSSVNVGTMSVSGTASLNTIPRASTLSAFSFNANLKNGTANRINYTVNRRSTNFRHQIQLRDGSTTVLTWDNVSSNGSTNITLTAANVNTLLNRMSSSTTKSYTLRIATRSGVDGGWIGSAVTRSATATVHADVKPSLSGLSVSQVGNSVSTDYLQNISKVKASFTRSAGYGASITSSRIIVRRVSGAANSQTINSNNGTTSNAINLTGAYEVIAQATDSRGRSGTQLRATFTSVAYSPPVITSFTATRKANEGAASRNIDWYRAGTHSGLSNKNSATGIVEYRVAGGTWTQASRVVSSSGSWGSSGTATGLSETNSFEFRFTLTDSFGYSDSQTITVSTARVVLDIHKNQGIGIGKLHERGVLDVSGEAYFSDLVHFQGGIKSQRVPAGANLNDITRTGFYYNNLNRDVGTMTNRPDANAFALLVEETAGVRQTWTRYGTNTISAWVRQNYSGSWGAWTKIH